MDKLKPILAQKFWILFSLVLILPLVGYFMTKGKLAAEIDDRWKKLDSTFTGIPTGTGVPNDSWTKKLNEINESQKIHNIRANQELWAKQRERMTWPKDIAPIMSKAEYFKELTEQQKGGHILFTYPLGYEAQVRALWEIVEPLDDGVNLRDSNKRRKVAFPMSDLQISRIAKLGGLQPTFAEIWGAQEDIWLQTELLRAIARLNENAISQGDASIKQLGKILMFGGTKATGDAGTAAAGGGAGGDMAGSGMMGGFGGGMGGQRSETSAALSTDINYAEEFNVEKEAGSGGAGGMKDMASAFSGASGPADASGGAKSDVKRYIDFDEKLPYKRRGFYIKVVMDHRKVPDLLAELMNSPFPVEIVRVQQVWYADASASPSGGGTSGGAGAQGFGAFKSPMPRGDGADAAFAPTSTPGSDSDTVGGGGGPGRSGATNPGSVAAMADPNLAHVAILGVWTLYLPPPAIPNAGQAAPTNSAIPAPAVAATPENTTPAVAPSAETAASDAKPAATEPADAAGDEAKKPDDPDAPKSEPTKPEKSDSDTEKPATEKTPPKAEPTDKPAEKSEAETK